MNKKQTLTIAAIVAATALAAGVITFTGGSAGEKGHDEHATHANESKEKAGKDEHGHDKEKAAGEHAEHADHDEHEEDGDHKEGDRIAFTPEQIRSAGIVVAEAGLVPMATQVQLPGEIRFDADRTAHVVPRVAGVVEAVPVRLGQAVKKGQLLATINSGAVSDLRSEAQTARQRLALAQANYTREKKLWEEKISAEQDYQQARQALHEAEITTRNTNQKLAALGAGGGDGSGGFQLRAPFDGTVVEKHITLGEMVREDTAVFTLSDLSRVWAEIDVPASQLNTVRVGASATVKASAFDAAANGKVAYVGALLGDQTRTAKAHIVLPNPGGAWRPGMFVSVDVAAGEAKPALAVPMDAVHRLEERDVVFVETEGGFSARPVKTGRNDGERIEIVSGLDAGQRYAAKGAFLIKAELGRASAEHSH